MAFLERFKLHIKRCFLGIAMMIPVAAEAQVTGTDVMMGDTLQEVTVSSHSAQKRMDEVQIGVENIEVSCCRA